MLCSEFDKINGMTFKTYFVKNNLQRHEMSSFNTMLVFIM